MPTPPAYYPDMEENDPLDEGWKPNARLKSNGAQVMARPHAFKDGHWLVRYETGIREMLDYSAVEIVEGIPFSSEDEAKGIQPIETAVALVQREIRNFDVLAGQFTPYVVWFAYILGGWKALVSTTLPNGQYFEVTFNKEKNEFYVDSYAKIRNSVY